MCAHVIFNLLNELMKRDKMRGMPSILSLFCNESNKSNNKGVQMLDSIYHMPLKVLKTRIFDVKTSIFYHLLHNVIMDVITLRYEICKPLVVDQFYCMALYQFKAQRYVIKQFLNIRLYALYWYIIVMYVHTIIRKGQPVWSWSMTSSIVDSTHPSG